MNAWRIYIFIIENYPTSKWNAVVKWQTEYIIQFLAITSAVHDDVPRWWSRMQIKRSMQCSIICSDDATAAKNSERNPELWYESYTTRETRIDNLFILKCMNLYNLVLSEFLFCLNRTFNDGKRIYLFLQFV